VLAANKTVMRRFFEELFNTGDLSVADEIVGTDYINYNAAPCETPGREGLKAFVTSLRRSFPDIHFTVEDLIAEDDKVVTRFSISATHQGEFAGIPATGTSVHVTALNIHRLAGGLIHEAWLQWDALGMMQQLGAIPGPG
jgi:steroid delta-isomerase-like uncharacterized protein